MRTAKSELGAHKDGDGFNMLDETREDMLIQIMQWLAGGKPRSRLHNHPRSPETPANHKLKKQTTNWPQAQVLRKCARPRTSNAAYPRLLTACCCHSSGLQVLVLGCIWVRCDLDDEPAAVELKNIRACCCLALAGGL